MSWSVNAVGKSDAVAKKAADEFERARTYLAEPEKTIAVMAGQLVAEALRAQIPATAVKITCSGSMSKSSTPGQPDVVTNSLSIVIDPIWGYVE